ncbi:MAG: hypothetical protein JNK05_06830 [Myxococcales bacterium]|nr:hypothetical protein [Myxococcales bacterium]
MPVPLWVRALQRADRVAWYAYHGYEVLREELLFAYLPSSERAAVIQHAYEAQDAYLPGGATFERGLFSWEKSLLAREEVPKSGRVLLAAAGGGRELEALGERGYEVCAFEPNPVLRRGAEEVASRFGARVYDGLFSDLSTAVRDEGPLASLRAQSPYALVVLGWGSITHVLEDEERIALLESVRALAPTAPVIVSFFLRPERNEGAPIAKTERLRKALRGAFARMGGRNHGVPEGLAYEAGGGFVYAFTESEVQSMAHRAGYAVRYFCEAPFPHALFVPHA